MSKCDIICFSVPEIPGMASSSAKAVGRCQTHQMQVVPGEMLCAIGKVEDAVEQGLAKIHKAIAERD